MWIMVGAWMAFLGVAAGAFGAHALRGSVNDRDLEIFQTAVQYQLIHAIGILIIGFSRGAGGRWWSEKLAAWCFVSGIVLFSGSLYILVLTGQRWFGAITPMGGIAFLAGWVMVGVSGWKQAKGSNGPTPP